MPIKIPNNLPATHVLEGENIFVMDADRAYSQDIRPLRILILNLMPIKSVTETQLLRLLGNTPLQVEVDFIYTESYTPSHTPMDYLAQFYGTFEEVRHKKYDGMIITGAPVENMEFEEVAYWDEVAEIMEWSKKHVYSTFHICWGAQAGLYYHYGIPKYQVPEKIFGVFKHNVLEPLNPIFRGFDDVFYVPHSRHTEILPKDIDQVPEIKILASSNDAGLYMMMAKEGRELYLLGHAEYNARTLDTEYRRDLQKGLHIDIPKNYYPYDDPDLDPLVRWRSTANLMFSNWLNYFVYQETPYNIEDIK
jgi:homoserine O-succinyltransferase